MSLSEFTANTKQALMLINPLHTQSAVSTHSQSLSLVSDSGAASLAWGYTDSVAPALRVVVIR